MSEMRDSNPLSAVYSKFRALYYRDVLHRVKLRELSLTTSEVYCVDIIHNLDKPTIQEFSNYIGISTPNASYKINSLIKKGYLKKVQSETDKREFILDENLVLEGLRILYEKNDRSKKYKG